MELFEKDFIKVKSKREAAEHLERCYGDFGWSLTEKKDDKLYYDTVHMAFSRPHGMPYKDELQLLQVRLELAFNKTGKYARKKPLNSLICAFFYFVSALLFVCCGALLILFKSDIALIISASLLFAATLFTIASGSFISLKIYRSDVKTYDDLIDKTIAEIEVLCKKARRLRGINE